MTRESMTIEYAQERDAAAIDRLLQEANLPTSDLTLEHLPHFVVMREAERIMGVAAVERIGGKKGLLRSLAVQHQYRGKGIAAQLYQAAEQHACSMGLHELYALTTTIADWLERLGYSRIERSNAPEELRQTAEFSTLCPASAVILRKSLSQTVHSPHRHGE